MPDVVSSFQSMIRSGYDGLAIRHTSYTAKTTSVKIYQGQAWRMGTTCNNFCIVVQLILAYVGL